MKAVRGVLVVDLRGCLDDLGRTTPDAAVRVWETLTGCPNGIPVIVDIGDAVALDARTVDLLVEHLEPVGDVEVRGSRTTAVAGLRRRLAAEVRA